MKENQEEHIEDNPESTFEEKEGSNDFEELDLESEPSKGNGSLEDQEIQGEIYSDLDEGSLETVALDEKTLKQQVREFHRNLIEASLYAAGSPLTIEEISTKLEISKKEVEELVNELAFDYLERTTALIIAQIGDRFQMQIRPEYTEKVSQFAKGGAIAEKYLRTLTVVALKQPLLKSTLIKIRGTGAYEHVKYLLDNGFINAVKKGRSHELTTTDKYADMFGLPKDKTELKRAMATQLGIEDISDSYQSEERDFEGKDDINDHYQSMDETNLPDKDEENETSK
ncbi:MAG: SMC-Scp complex subunit ScpB [Promethearchaeota archaeon]